MRRASAIRCLAASRNSTRIAAALFEQKVQIWDLESSSAIKDFDTVFSSGGARLALDSSGERCVAAGWKSGQRGGVACYETTTGKLIWHRPDLRETQRLRFAATDAAVWCVPESGPTERLDSVNGRTLDTVTGLRNIFDSDYSPDLLLEKRNHNYILRKSKDLQIPRLTFAILDAAFGRRSLAISEAGGPVRCIDSATGQELWRYSPGNDLHFLRLWYCNTDQNFYGVQWDFRKGSFRSFVRLNNVNGENETLCHLDSWEETCCTKLRCLVTSSGEMISLCDGKLLHRLHFPQTDYADINENLPRA